MTLTEHLSLLMATCNSVSLSINPHKTISQDAKDYLLQYEYNINECSDAKEVYDQMVDKNTIVELKVYPFPPLGVYTVLHWDLNQAITEAYEVLGNVHTRKKTQKDA